MPAPKYPPRTPGVWRISQSELETYLRCGIRWQFEKEQKHRTATIPMVIGAAISELVKFDNEAKMNATRSTLKLTEFHEVAQTAYERELRDSEVLGSGVEKENGRNDVHGAATGWLFLGSDKITDVVGAEKSMLCQIDDWELAGTADTITKDTVRDTKTGQPWNQDRVEKSRQLTGYSLLIRANFGSYPSRVAIDNVWRQPRSKGSDGWGVRTFWDVREERDFIAFIDVAMRARKAMDAGVVLPAPEGAWWCSRKWCPFWSRCPAVAAGR